MGQYWVDLAQTGAAELALGRQCLNYMTHKLHRNTKCQIPLTIPFAGTMSKNFTEAVAPGATKESNSTNGIAEHAAQQFTDNATPPLMVSSSQYHKNNRPLSRP